MRAPRKISEYSSFNTAPTTRCFKCKVVFNITIEIYVLQLEERIVAEFQIE
jgi:hypothetical protein